MASETGPDHPFQHISRNVNKIVEQMQKGYFNFRPNDTWAPNVNLYETDEQYLVCVDLAGVDKDKINLVVTNNRLMISGSRAAPRNDLMHVPPQEPQTPPDGVDAAPVAQPAVPYRTRVHLMEIDHGAFCREVELPNDVDSDAIHAEHRNGFLWVQIPKRRPNGR
jgi:HSP20 family protein